jgi:predicted amidophosphoribosyltransferase
MTRKPRRRVDISDGRDAEFLVCLLRTDPLKMPDNLIDVCVKCWQAIQHRPNVPPVPKICEVCAKPLLEDNRVRIAVTEKTLQEARDYWRKHQ